MTGEERLREHLDSAYGALLSYEGRPGDYQVERVRALEGELAAVEEQTQTLLARELPRLNEVLQKSGLAPLSVAGADTRGQQFAAARAWKEAIEGQQSGVAAQNGRVERD